MNIAEINEAKLQFVAVKPNRFVIDGKGYAALDVMIEDIFPVRKLFEETTLVCYSSDGKNGKSGKHCLLCRERFRCQRRMRLMLMIQNIGDEPVPALLEINPQSFEHLQALIDSLDQRQIASTLVKLTVGKNEKEALTVLFATMF